MKKFSVAQFGAFRILFLMAAEVEYGKHQQALFTPAIIGVGPVEAAVSTTAILAELDAQGALPDLAVSLGSAGSARLEQGQVYQVGAVSWRDMDARALGMERGVTPFLDLPAVVPMPVFSTQLPVATLSTGGDVVSSHAYQAIEADMVDMETYAVLRACQRFNVTLLGLRGISDGREEVRQMDDWQQALHLVDKKLADSVMLLKMRLEQEADLAFLRKNL